MRVIKKIFVFLFFGVVIYVTGVFLMCSIPYKGKPFIYITNDYYHWKGGATYTNFRQFDINKKYDVIILGSSRAYRGYDPRIFRAYGYDAWNLGTGAQTINNTYFILKNYIKSENCKLLIIDIFSGAFKNTGLESASDLIQNVSSEKAAFEIALNTADIRALNMYAVRIMTGKMDSMYNDKDYTEAGFSEKHDRLPDKLVKTLPNASAPKSTINAEDYDIGYLEKILDYCTQNKIKVVLTYAPTSDFYSSKVHTAFLNKINPVIAKYHVPLLDYSKKLKISTLEHFYDDSHMNYDGVKIFNNALVKDLEYQKMLDSNE